MNLKGQGMIIEIIIFGVVIFLSLAMFFLLTVSDSVEEENVEERLDAKLGAVSGEAAMTYILNQHIDQEIDSRYYYNVSFMQIAQAYFSTSEDIRIGTINSEYETEIIDGFESGNLNSYEFVGEGDQDYISADSEYPTVFEGDRSLKLATAGLSGNGIRSDSGLENYPGHGKTVSWRTYIDKLNLSDTSTRFETRLGSKSDGVRVIYDVAEKQLRLGNAEVSEPVDWSKYMDTWIYTEVEWDENSKTVRVFEDGSRDLIADIEHEEVSADSSQIYFGINSGNAEDSIVYIDKVMIGGRETLDRAKVKSDLKSYLKHRYPDSNSNLGSKINYPGTRAVFNISQGNEYISHRNGESIHDREWNRHTRKIPTSDGNAEVELWIKR